MTSVSFPISSISLISKASILDLKQKLKSQNQNQSWQVKTIKYWVRFGSLVITLTSQSK